MEAAISTTGGEVTLDLGILVAQTERSGVGVSATSPQKLPPDAGQLTILRSDQL